MNILLGEQKAFDKTLTSLHDKSPRDTRDTRNINKGNLQQPHRQRQHKWKKKLKHFH